jgi:hypothetical protein
MGKLMSESCSRVLTAVCIASSVLLFSAGCASGGGSGSLPANTHATLLITATNNAKIPIFKFNIQTLTLLADDGTSVPILTTPQLVELGSISGVARPLVTTDVPQKNYVFVKLTYGPSNFVVIDKSGAPGSTNIATYNIGPPTTATVQLPLTTSLVVTGSAMGMLLNLNIPQSTTYTPFLDGSSTLAPDGGKTSFKPVFSLSAVSLAAIPARCKMARWKMYMVKSQPAPATLLQSRPTAVVLSPSTHPLQLSSQGRVMPQRLRLAASSM